jgi:2-dehydro-3-deoxyphosphogluconate aldolase/(4S)-4-hydroxy-2-oxoglutarate aldolase
MKRPSSTRELLGRVPVVPVVTIAAADSACELARALLKGGIAAIEVTLRTPASLAAIEAIARGVPEVAVGAGTVLSREDMRSAEAAGAMFTVSPGSTPELLAAGRESVVPYLPGAATASELQHGIAAGYDCFKFFPAVALGGPAALSVLGGPFPQLAFCATGGITAAGAQSWLDLPNVLAVGGSWIAPPDAIARRDWAAIEARALEAAARFRPKAPR